MTDQASPSLEQQLAELQEQGAFAPPASFVERARITDRSVHEQAAQDPVGWWAQQAEELLHWHEPFTKTLDDGDPPFYTWFEDGRINASYNCLDRHVDAGHGDRVAFKWYGEEGEQRDLTYADLLAETQRFANVLKARGVEQGDVVGIFLPMIPEVVVAMLACARIGAAHNVVFGGFSATSVAERMEVSKAKLLVTVDGARRKGKVAPVKQQVDEQMPDLPCVVVRHVGNDAPMKDSDVFYDEALEHVDDACEAEGFPAEQPLFILYSSGSTAKPKGILHTTGGYLTGVTWTHRNVFDLKPEEDVYWCSADVGWITGHSYIVYGPMSNGATSVMYEGAPDYPDKDAWWDVAEKSGATIFYTAPTAIRACIKWGAQYVDKHDLSKLRLLGTVGEPINPKAWVWYWKVVGGGRCPVVDTWWQTETGAIMITTLPGAQDAIPGSAGTTLPGLSAEVREESSGEVAERGKQGLLALTAPWPSMLRTLYEDDDRYVKTYWDKWDRQTYLVGDAARQTEDDYFWVIGRIDDVINVSGHRLSTAEVESAIVSHPKVAESAVIGMSDEDTGQAIAAFVTLEGDLRGSDELRDEVREHVAQKIGKLARPKKIVWAEDLPKTRSGKIMRRLLRDIAEGRDLGDVTTLRDPDVVKDLQAQV